MDEREPDHKQVQNPGESIQPDAVRTLLAQGAYDLEVNLGRWQYYEIYEHNPELQTLQDGYRRITASLALPDNLSSGPRSLTAARCAAVQVITNTPNLYAEMDEISQGCLDMAHALFNNWGALRPEFTHPPSGQGTSVWHQGFNWRPVLLIDELQVMPGCGRLGIGRRLIDALLHRVCTTSGDWWYAVAYPTLFWTVALSHQLTQLPESKRRAVISHHTQRSVAFFRSLGFRRIGASAYFAWSPRSDHPSRLLALEDDYDPS